MHKFWALRDISCWESLFGTAICEISSKYVAVICFQIITIGAHMFAHEIKVRSPLYSFRNGHLCWIYYGVILDYVCRFYLQIVCRQPSVGEALFQCSNTGTSILSHALIIAKSCNAKYKLCTSCDLFLCGCVITSFWIDAPPLPILVKVTTQVLERSYDRLYDREIIVIDMHSYYRFSTPTKPTRCEPCT